MSERRRNEKNEKEDEQRQEKSWDEKWRRDRTNALTWATVLIWGGLVLLAETTKLMAGVDWWRAWSVFFLGWGVIILAGAGIRSSMPERRRPVAGSLIMGFVLLGVGLGGLVGWRFAWPLVLIAVGVIIVLRAFVSRR